jgi:hypothetical protein
MSGVKAFHPSQGLTLLSSIIWYIHLATFTEKFIFVQISDKIKFPMNSSRRLRIKTLFFFALHKYNEENYLYSQKPRYRYILLHSLISCNVFYIYECQLYPFIEITLTNICTELYIANSRKRKDVAFFRFLWNCPCDL